MENKPQPGRPRKGEDVRLEESALYQLFLAKLPTEFVKYDRVDTLRLSEALKTARFTIYCWFHGRPLSRKSVLSLLQLSAESPDEEKSGALSKEDLLPFII